MEDNLDVKSLNDSITMETVMAFVNVFRTGKLKPYAMSARLPRDWDKRPMKIIVANNYTEVADGTSVSLGGALQSYQAYSSKLFAFSSSPKTLTRSWCCYTIPTTLTQLRA